MHTQRTRRTRTLRLITASLLATLAAAACGDAGTGPGEQTPPATRVALVEVSPEHYSLDVGQEHGFTAYTRAASGLMLTGRQVTWTSSNETVATVDATGKVTARGPGSATIVATSEGRRGESTVSVAIPPIPVASIRVAPAPVSLVPGGSKQLAALAYDADGMLLGEKLAQWAVLDATVAIVDPYGKVTAVRAGTTTVTAVSDGKVGSAVITVTAPPPAPDSTVYYLRTRDGRPFSEPRISTTTWVDEAGVSHPAEVVLTHGLIKMKVIDGVLRYRQTVVPSTFTLDFVPGEIRWPVAEQRHEDGGEVLQHYLPDGTVGYTFRSTSSPGHQLHVTTVNGGLQFRQMVPTLLEFTYFYEKL